MWKNKLYFIQRSKILKTELNNYFTVVNADYQHAKEFITVLRDNCILQFLMLMPYIYINIKI